MTVLVVLTWTTSARAESEAGASSTTYSAAYEFYGRAPYPLNSTGARLGYRMSSSSELELSYIKSTKSVLLSDFVYSEYNLQLKNWLGTFLYWHAGVGLRDVSIESSVAVLDDETTVQQAIKQEHRAITANFGVGTEVPITDNIVFGSDLLSLSAPISWTKRENDFPDNADESEEDPNTYPFLKDGLRANFHLVRTFIKVRL